MRYLVTGGAGFIGSHLVEELVNKNNSVIILDNFSSGKYSNIAKYEKNDENIECIKGSIENVSLLKKLCAECDGIFHEAAMVSVLGSVSDPLRTHAVNCTGTLNLLIAAREAGIKNVVIASSSAVYGDTTEMPQNETFTPRPLSPYAVSKLTGEYYSKVFSELYGMKITNLRYFNVYGSRQDPSSDYAAVIPQFITKILLRKPITIHGDGNQTRDFIYVKDVVSANLNAMKYQPLE